MRVINKILIDGIEYLPDITNTEIFDEWEKSENKEIRLIAGLYKALSERENYFQNNTPTAFGNPEYSLLCGIVSGFLQGSELEMDEDDNHFIVKRGKKTVLIVDKIKRCSGYYEAKKEIAETLYAILG